MPFVQRGNSRLYYEVVGEGPPIVLSHGVGGNHASWFSQIATLADRYRVLTWDHRGFGLSTDEEKLGRAAFVDDLMAVLDSAEFERSVLVGQSMGGGTSLATACTHPDRVSGLVMADSLSQAVLPPEVAERLKRNAEATAGLSQIARVLGGTIQRERPEAVVLYSQIAGFNTTNLRTLGGEMPTFTVQQLEATQVRSLFIVGEEDLLFPSWAVRAFRQHLSRSSYVELARTGHSAFFERPDAFNAVLEAWLLDLGYAPALIAECDCSYG